MRSSYPPHLYPAPSQDMADVSQRERSMIAETPAIGVQRCTVIAGDSATMALVSG